MVKRLYTAEELCNRFAYDPEAGVISWRVVPFEVWADKPTSSLARYGNWLRQCAGKPVALVPLIGKGFVVALRGRTYTAARLAWTLHHKAFPKDTQDVIFKNRDFADLRLCNLELASRGARAARRESSKRALSVPASARALVSGRPHSPQLLRQWFAYRDGEVLMREPGLSAWARRMGAADEPIYQAWVSQHVGRPVAFRPERSRNPERREWLTFCGTRYEKAGLIYALVHGVEMNPSVSLRFINGDVFDYRVENLELCVLDGEGA